MSRALADNAAQPTKVFVLQPSLKFQHRALPRSPESLLEEAVGLAHAINLDIVGAEVAMISKISPATYIGKGLADTLKQRMTNDHVKLLFVNTDLSPGQQRNLENATKCKVIDRTGMILEIFGARARTHEGQLQVELAALNFQRSRLVRSWTHLERQRGGGGFLGGPGEKQLELDRRMLEARIEHIKRDLKEVVRTRRLQRQSRLRNDVPTIALIGYTNAGKSTLFNRLTTAGVLAKDMLFATLDPTIRPFKLPNGKKALLSDTVGFISDLPTQLIAAFRATLEEVQEADLLLHVRDITHPETEAQKQDVEKVLNELGMVEAEWRNNLIEVWNKCDLLLADQLQSLQENAKRDSEKTVIPVSAASGQGISELLHAIELKLNSASQRHKIVLPAGQGDAIAWLYRHGQVIDRADLDNDSALILFITAAELARFESLFHGLKYRIDPAN